MTPLVLDLDQARAHVAALTGSADTAMGFRALPEAPDFKAFSEGVFGPLAEVWSQLTEWNNLGHGIFVLVNDTEGEGFKDANVKRLRAVFTDNDHAEAPTYRVPPTFGIGSKRGEHRYWVLDEESRPLLDLFEPTQKALAQTYGTDPAVHNLARVMRLAGSYHVKEVATPVTVIPGAGVGYALDTIFASCGELIAEGGRDNALIKLAGRWQNELKGDALRLELRVKAANAYRCVPPLPHADVDRIVRQAQKFEVHEKAPDGVFLTAADAIRAMPDATARHATGWPEIDACTRGGARVGEIWAFIGRAGAAKSVAMQNLAVRFAKLHGATVLHVPADEGAGAPAIRLGQMLGLDRFKLENKDPEEVARLADLQRSLNYTFAEPDETTLEAATRRLQELPGDFKILLLDTTNTVRAIAGEDAGSTRERTGEIVKAYKIAAKTGPCLVIVGCEANRSSWASSDPAKRTHKLASGAETRAIEHASTVQFDMSPIDGDDFTFIAEVVKNRVGGRKTFVHLRLDPDRAELAEVDGLNVIDVKEEKRREKANRDEDALRELIVRIVRQHGPLNTGQLARRVGKNRDKLNRMLDRLEEDKILTSEKGKGTEFIWKIKEHHP
jgi:hypothetical protein